MHDFLAERFRNGAGYSALLLFLLLLAVSGSVSAASLDAARSRKLTLSAVQGYDRSYALAVKAVQAGDLVYVDLVSLSRALRLKSGFDGTELTISSGDGAAKSTCRVLAGNAFARFRYSAPAAKERVVQLRSDPVRWKKSLWMPAPAAARLFALWLDREVSYKPKEQRIDAFLWSAPPGSKNAVIGIVGEADRTVGLSGLPGYSGPTVITGIEVSELANGVVVRLRATGAKSVVSFLKPDAQGKAYLTFQKAKGDPSGIFRAFSRGLLREIRATPLGNGAIQVTLALDSDLFSVKSSDYRWDARTNSYVVSILSDVDVQELYRREKEKRIRQDLAQDLNRWKFNTIVLDAGHGGKDPGAIGAGGTREKDIVLNITRDLGAIIAREWPDVKVVYTRRDDRFIPLKQRGRIANRNDGKLFVSIHCNAAKNRSAKGAEVYILGPHKNDAALRVAMLENEAIKQEADYKKTYKGFTDEHLIMSSLAQNAFTLQSKEAARHVLAGMEKKTRINGRGVRQAGFMVLWTPSMPSVLVEAGYLSNREEEKMLRSRQVQKNIAEGIFNGLKQYRNGYEKQRVASGSDTRPKG